MKLDTITLPAYWASALVNGDYSGLEHHDHAEAERCRRAESALRKHGGWTVVSADDAPRFTWHYRIYDPGAKCTGGEIMDYVLVGH